MRAHASPHRYTPDQFSLIHLINQSSTCSSISMLSYSVNPTSVFHNMYTCCSTHEKWSLGGYPLG